MPRRHFRHLLPRSVVVKAIFVVLHLLFTGVLILFILLHRGAGGGLSDMFGGGGGSLGGSAVVEKNLDRMTIVSAVGFVTTTVILGQIL